jgi:hypothetical protein
LGSANPGQPVTTAYEAPFAFTAEIEHLEIVIK